MVRQMKTLRISLVLTFAAAGLATAEMRANVDYGLAGGETLKLDANVPDGKGPFPTVILVHGGGWRGGSKEVFITPLFKPLTEAGFTWFSINYRLAPTNHYPAAVDDLITAVRWVKAHAAEYKVDDKRIALVGESAGGHLVAFVGSRNGRELGIAAVVPYYAPCDLEALTIGEGKTERASTALGSFLDFTRLDDQARRLLREASPITYVKKDMPPFLLIHGTQDTTVPYNQSVQMRDRMEAAGASCELFSVENGAHGMGGWEKEPKLQAHKAELTRWLKKTLRF
jgi:acetyl esterase